MLRLRTSRVTQGLPQGYIPPMRRIAAATTQRCPPKGQRAPLLTLMDFVA
jgi:hypothetical protein